VGRETMVSPAPAQQHSMPDLSGCGADGERGLRYPDPRLTARSHPRHGTVRFWTAGKARNCSAVSRTAVADGVFRSRDLTL